MTIFKQSARCKADKSSKTRGTKVVCNSEFYAHANIRQLRAIRYLPYALSY